VRFTLFSLSNVIKVNIKHQTYSNNGISENFDLNLFAATKQYLGIREMRFREQGMR
jgi:hypothetical protein